MEEVGAERGPSECRVMRWWCVCLLAASLAAGTQAASVFDLMSEDPDLSEVRSYQYQYGVIT